MDIIVRTVGKCSGTYQWTEKIILNVCGVLHVGFLCS
jgi:hypothetical protein